MMVVICHDGERRTLGDKPYLELVQALVGGLIERVPGTQNVWVNEDGLRLHLPINIDASNIYGQNLVGQVVIADLD